MLVCLVDSSSAFDTVWHAGLFYKLHKLGVMVMVMVMVNFYSALILSDKLKCANMPLDIVFGKDFDTALVNLEAVWTCMRRANLRLKTLKMRALPC